MARHVQITQIFALATLTYLYVVISGANPELPEIQKNVLATMKAFESLSEPTLLQNLVWPFCITGCLASKDQYHTFRHFIFRAEITDSTLGTCTQAFKIIEECWETRKTCSGTIDWAGVMLQCYHEVLLK